MKLKQRLSQTNQEVRIVSRPTLQSMSSEALHVGIISNQMGTWSYTKKKEHQKC